MMCSSPVCRLLWRMPLLFHYLSVFVPLAVSMVSVVDSGKNSLPPIYWNSSNPLFGNGGSYTININQNDILEIYCPYYNGTDTADEHMEYYTIFIVDESVYDSCVIPEVKPADLIVNCSEPKKERIFTIFVQSFSSIPNSRDYQPGTYYFITTSTGTSQGINNQYNGACTSKNMKVKMIVCCSSTNPSTQGTNITSATQGPSQTTPKPSSSITIAPTTTTTHSTTRPSTTTTRQTTGTTTPQLTTTTKLPGGKPHDPTDIIIDAPGTIDNVGVINSAVTLRPCIFVLVVTAFLLTFALFSR